MFIRMSSWVSLMVWQPAARMNTTLPAADNVVRLHSAVQQFDEEGL
jgi:hypothetical protein